MKGVGGEEEAVPDASLEQDSGGSGAVRESARLVAGTAKKRRCLDSAQVLDTTLQREGACFQAVFSQQAERAEDVEMGTLEILRLEEEAYERDAVLLGTPG